MIVVIDGPAGSGKSSTAKAVADELDIQYLDSGALYRALTLIYIEAGKNKDAFFELLNQQSVSFHYREGQFKVFINGKDVSEKIRSVDVTRYVSEVAALPRARTYVNDLMRAAVNHDLYIAEGRDLGTAVFPDAELKFFMIADVETRAQRRYREMKKRNPGITLKEVRENIQKRDQIDSQRKSDPLRKADDAFEIDTTNLTFEQQVRFICSKITDKL